MLRLHIGCGEQHLDQYVNIDIRKTNATDLVINGLYDLYQKYDACTVDEIYTRHMLEHLSMSDSRLYLSFFRSALKRGGVIRIEVPDLDYHARQLLHPDNYAKESELTKYETCLSHCLHSIYGWQRNEHDFHKSGYNAHILRALLEEFGFLDAERVESKPWNLAMKATKGERCKN